MLNPILLDLALQQVKSSGELKGPHEPPGYRIAAGEVSRCASCKNFVQGHCRKFKIGVDANFVCDEWEGSDMHLPSPAGISPGAGVIGGAVPIAAGQGTIVKMSDAGLDSITPQIDQGPVVAAPLKSGGREGSAPTDQVEEGPPSQVNETSNRVNNNPKATESIFGMSTKAADGGGGGGGGAGGGGGGAAAGGASSGSVGTSAPGGYGSSPSPGQVHSLQVGFSGQSGDKRRRAKDLLKQAVSADAVPQVKQSFYLPIVNPRAQGFGAMREVLQADPNLRNVASRGKFEKGLRTNIAPSRLRERLAARLGGETIRNQLRAMAQEVAGGAHALNAIAGTAAIPAVAGLGYGAYRLLKSKDPQQEEEMSDLTKSSSLGGAAVGAGLGDPELAQRVNTHGVVAHHPSWSQNLTKSSGLMGPSIGTGAITPPQNIQRPNAAQGVQLPSAKPLTAAQPGDLPWNPQVQESQVAAGGTTSSPSGPAGPRGGPPPTGQQSQVQPQDPSEQPPPQPPAPQSNYKPSPLVTLYPNETAVYGKFVQPAPPPENEKMATSLPIEELADLAARIKVASDSASQPSKPSAPVQPVQPSVPKVKAPVAVKTAESLTAGPVVPPIQAPTQQRVPGSAFTPEQRKAIDLPPRIIKSVGAPAAPAKKLITGVPALGIGKSGGADISVGWMRDSSSSGGRNGGQVVGNGGQVVGNVKMGKLTESQAPHGLHVAVTGSSHSHLQEKVARRLYTKLAAMAKNSNLGSDFDPLATDLTKPIDPNSLIARGLAVQPQTHEQSMSQHLGVGQHPGISGKSPGRSTGYLDPTTMTQLRGATGQARTVLDIDSGPKTTMFDPNRFQSLMQIASTGDQRAYGQLENMVKGMESTGEDPSKVRMARMRMKDIAMQHPHFNKTAMAIRLGELAGDLIKSSASPSLRAPTGFATGGAAAGTGAPAPAVPAVPAAPRTPRVPKLITGVPALTPAPIGADEAKKVDQRVMDEEAAAKAKGLPALEPGDAGPAAAAPVAPAAAPAEKTATPTAAPQPTGQPTPQDLEAYRKAGVPPQRAMQLYSQGVTAQHASDFRRVGGKGNIVNWSQSWDRTGQAAADAAKARQANGYNSPWTNAGMKTPSTAIAQDVPKPQPKQTVANAAAGIGGGLAGAGKNVDGAGSGQVGRQLGQGRRNQRGGMTGGFQQTAPAGGFRQGGPGQGPQPGGMTGGFKQRAPAGGFSYGIGQGQNGQGNLGNYGDNTVPPNALTGGPPKEQSNLGNYGDNTVPPNALNPPQGNTGTYGDNTVPPNALTPPAPVPEQAPMPTAVPEQAPAPAPVQAPKPTTNQQTGQGVTQGNPSQLAGQPVGGTNPALQKPLEGSETVEPKPATTTPPAGSEGTGEAKSAPTSLTVERNPSPRAGPEPGKTPYSPK